MSPYCSPCTAHSSGEGRVHSICNLFSNQLHQALWADSTDLLCNIQNLSNSLRKCVTHTGQHTLLRHSYIVLLKVFMRTLENLNMSKGLSASITWMASSGLSDFTHSVMTLSSIGHRALTADCLPCGEIRLGIFFSPLEMFLAASLFLLAYRPFTLDSVKRSSGAYLLPGYSVWPSNLARRNFFLVVEYQHLSLLSRSLNALTWSYPDAVTPTSWTGRLVIRVAAVYRWSRGWSLL